MDIRNASYNISQFMMGFAMGAYGEPLEDLTWCVNDTIDITSTLRRDFMPILNGTSLERAAALSDLVWHLVRDIPDVFSSCGHLKNDTMDIIEITEALFRDLREFRTIAAALLHSMGPSIKYITAAALAFEDGDWYRSGDNVGLVFRIVIEYAYNQVK
jgi:hypothetical protein